METYYPVIYLIIAFIIVVLAITFTLKVRNAHADLNTKLTGLWTNEAHTVRIILHHEDSVFQAEIVWADLTQVRKELLGFKMIKQLMYKGFQFKSLGVYVDPFTEMEYPVRVYLKGKGKMRLSVFAMVNGSNELIKEETWHQI